MASREDQIRGVLHISAIVDSFRDALGRVQSLEMELREVHSALGRLKPAVAPGVKIQAYHGSGPSQFTAPDYVEHVQKRITALLAPLGTDHG